MGYILDASALLRVIVAKTEDPLVIWLEAEQIVPFAVMTTAAQAYSSIQTGDLKPEQRTALRKRLDMLVEELGEDSSQAVSALDSDAGTVRILGEMLPIDAGAEFGDFDLIPAALAMQHNLEFVVAERTEAWAAMTAEIPEEIGTLTIRSFEEQASLA